MTTLTIKPAVTFTAFRGALRNTLQTSDNAFLSKLFSKDFSLEAVSEVEVAITLKNTDQTFRALVAGKKVVILNGKSSKASVNIGLTRQVAFNEFLKNENGYVLDLEANTVKAVVVSTGWVPADDILEHFTFPATFAMNNVVMASSKGSSGEIEHFLFTDEKAYSAVGIKEVREAITAVVEENGGFTVIEEAPKARKPRTISFASMECSKGTSIEAMRVVGRTRRENRKAYEEAGSDALLAQTILMRKNLEALI